MHAIRPDRRVLMAALVALVCGLAALVAAPSLSDLELGGSGGGAVPAEPARTVSSDAAPAWATDPLAPPSLLRERR